MTERFQITIKQSVFDAIGLSEEKYADETFTFESETAAEEWVADLDDDHSQLGSLTLHSAHPNDKSDVDAYLIFDPAERRRPAGRRRRQRVPRLAHRV